MIESPELFKISGNGELYNDKYNFSVAFKMFLINQTIVVYCYMDESPIFSIDINDNIYWTIKGYTSEREIFSADNLMITELNYGFVELVSNKGVIVGEFFDSNVDKIVYPITNLFNTNFSLNHNDFSISVKTEINSIKKNISEYWRIPQLNGELVIEKLNEPMSSFTKMANYILKLLSLGTGRYLSIGIQTYYAADKKYSYIQPNSMTTDHINPIVPNHELPNLLRIGLSTMYSWNIKKYIEYRTILEYLSTTDKGYLDDRVLKIVQCYEIIAHNWIESNYISSNEIKDLKKSLKITIKDWQKKYPKFDESGFWSNRIHQSLEWDKTVKLLENIIHSQNLDIDNLKVDFTKLVGLRHSVAHSGMFGEVDVIDDLISGQFALRIYLLKIFGYNGKIIDYKNPGFSNLRAISDFEKMASA